MKIVSVDIIDVKNPLQSAVAKWRPVVVRINTLKVVQNRHDTQVKMTF